MRGPGPGLKYSHEISELVDLPALAPFPRPERIKIIRRYARGRPIALDKGGKVFSRPGKEAIKYYYLDNPQEFDYYVQNTRDRYFGLEWHVQDMREHGVKFRRLTLYDPDEFENWVRKEVGVLCEICKKISVHWSASWLSSGFQCKDCDKWIWWEVRRVVKKEVMDMPLGPERSSIINLAFAAASAKLVLRRAKQNRSLH